MNKIVQRCSGCNEHSRLMDIEGSYYFCDECMRKYPPALLKATVDPFNYCLKLIDGTELTFESAVIHGEYATLELLPMQYDMQTSYANKICIEHRIERGLDIRVDQILWCYDMG